MKLIAVTPPTDIKDEQHHISLLIAEGFIVHCRKPEKSAVEMAAYLRTVAPEFRGAVAIHDHYELAEDMGIKRLHFPEKKRLETKFSDKNFQNFQLSSSFHDKVHLTEESTKPFSYVFCGPVFNSISKKDYPGNEDWQTMLPEVPFLEKIAIGGMTPDKLTSIRKWGYDGIAFSGFLWEKPEKMEESINEIKELWLKDLTY